MLKLRIATPEGKLFDDEVAKVEIKTIDGTITVLPNHIPLLTIIKDGYVVINGKKTTIKSATVTVNQNSSVDIIIDQK